MNLWTPSSECRQIKQIFDIKWKIHSNGIFHISGFYFVFHTKFFGNARWMYGILKMFEFIITRTHTNVEREWHTHKLHPFWQNTIDAHDYSFENHNILLCNIKFTMFPSHFGWCCSKNILSQNICCHTTTNQHHCSHHR